MKYANDFHFNPPTEHSTMELFLASGRECGLLAYFHFFVYIRSGR